MELNILLKILLSSLLGGMIGLEQELSGKRAGLRTNILIAIGSTLLAILSIEITKAGKIGDPGRIIAQIVTGIGFIGAGVIIQSGSAIHGLTTAATIWTVAAIGIAVGNGFYILAFSVTIFVILILILFKFLSDHIKNRSLQEFYSIKTKKKYSIINDVRKVIMECGINDPEWSIGKVRGGYMIELSLTASESKKNSFIEKVMEMEGIIEVKNE
ncbi:MAG: MgtC/SapB family protein [Acidobacteriota bacterium]